MSDPIHTPVDTDITETREIDIPAGALTTCPDRRYALVSIAAVCGGCPYSQGLWQVTRGDVPFVDRYRVKCGVPQVREITIATLVGGK